MAKEDIGKAVLYNPYPFSQGDISFVADYARKVIRAVTGQDTCHVSSDKVSTPGEAHIHFHIQELMKETFTKETGRITAIRTVTLNLNRLRGFSSYEKSVKCEEAGTHDEAHWDKEGYSLWVFTDGRQRNYRCKRWHSYAPREHFFYDTQVCGDDMLRAVEHGILQVFIDKGFRLTSVDTERLALAREWQKDERRLYVLGGTEHGDIER